MSFKLIVNNNDKLFETIFTLYILGGWGHETAFLWMDWTRAPWCVCLSLLPKVIRWRMICTKQNNTKWRFSFRFCRIYLAMSEKTFDVNNIFVRYKA